MCVPTLNGSVCDREPRVARHGGEESLVLVACCGTSLGGLGLCDHASEVFDFWRGVQDGASACGGVEHRRGRTDSKAMHGVLVGAGHVDASQGTNMYSGHCL